MQIMYGIGGETELPETTLDHLSGYEGAQPVRIGNDAYRQSQHDVWGAILDSFYLHTKSRDQLPERIWPILVKQVETALEHWREPDHGIWEVRGDPKHFTSSKVMCWVAADRGARLAEIRGDAEYTERWQSAADEIKRDVCDNALDERGVFCQHYETTALDASVLLLPLVRFLPSDDERIRATVFAIADELTVDGLVLRYRTEETDDGLHGEEGAFTICSFWLVSALTEIGELERARDLCEKLLSHASPLQLYAEEIDPRSGRHLGNFPQAFTHLALINAVVHVIRAELGLSARVFPFQTRPFVTHQPGLVAVASGRGPTRAERFGDIHWPGKDVWGRGAGRTPREEARERVSQSRWEGDWGVLLGGVNVDDRLIPELARIVPSALARKLQTASFYRSSVVGLTIDERDAILAALENPPESLGDLRDALLREVQWRRRERL